ncbi:uncharacterized protein RHO25_004481 [Cercospora beticola]|uniref:Uncharacterized protein n=1 Tax=Cercospora beticola TaxID=122368 RepID=A0ABZ0NJY2_CERBT|nr:hypothetical protein RHO25_004481 [Cercospora beticola]CAK1361971.1 unnamed protein product [Cercospora beticola]
MALHQANLGASAQDQIAAILAREGFENVIVTLHATSVQVPAQVPEQVPAQVPAQAQTQVKTTLDPVSHASTSSNATQAEPTYSIAIKVGSRVEAYKKCTERWMSFFQHMACQEMSANERADFESVRGMVQTIKKMVEANGNLYIPREVRDDIRHDLFSRRTVSAEYLGHSAAVRPHPDSPLAHGNRGHAYFQRAIREIGCLVDDLPA